MHQRAILPAHHEAAVIMELSFALQFFAVMLLLVCIALVPFVARRDPVPVATIVGIHVLPRSQWPGLLTRGASSAC
jgi:hypothetical protein